MRRRNHRQLATESLEQRQLFCADGLCLCGWDPVCGVDPAEVAPPIEVAPEGGPDVPSISEADLNSSRKTLPEQGCDDGSQPGVPLPVIPLPVCGDVDDVVPPERNGQHCFPTGCESDNAPLLPVNPFLPEEKLEDSLLPPEAVNWEIPLPNAGFALPDVDPPVGMSPEIERAIEEVSEELSRLYNNPPRLEEIPYVSRLFQNRAVDAESTSLMLMVTPRIIIQLESDE